MWHACLAAQGAIFFVVFVAVVCYGADLLERGLSQQGGCDSLMFTAQGSMQGDGLSLEQLLQGCTLLLVPKLQ